MRSWYPCLSTIKPSGNNNNNNKPTKKKHSTTKSTFLNGMLKCIPGEEDARRLVSMAMSHSIRWSSHMTRLAAKNTFYLHSLILCCLFFFSRSFVVVCLAGIFISVSGHGKSKSKKTRRNKTLFCGASNLARWQSVLVGLNVS